MKVKNNLRRPQKIGEVWIRPGQTIQVPDELDLTSQLSQGAITLLGAKIKEKKGGK